MHRGQCVTGQSRAGCGLSLGKGKGQPQLGGQSKLAPVCPALGAPSGLRSSTGSPQCGDGQWLRGTCCGETTEVPCFLGPPCSLSAVSSCPACPHVPLLGSHKTSPHPVGSLPRAMDGPQTWGSTIARWSPVPSLRKMGRACLSYLPGDEVGSYRAFMTGRTEFAFIFFC